MNNNNLQLEEGKWATRAAAAALKKIKSELYTKSERQVQDNIYKGATIKWKKRCEYQQLMWIIRSHLLQHAEISRAISTQYDVRLKHLLLSFFSCWIRKHIAFMYAREASGICKIVPKFKTSNYWFGKDAWFCFFLLILFCVFSFAILFWYHIRNVVLVWESGKHLILTIQSTRFRRLSEFDSIAVIKDENRSSYELCRWDQIEHSGKNRAAKRKKRTHGVSDWESERVRERENKRVRKCGKRDQTICLILSDRLRAIKSRIAEYRRKNMF